MKDLSKEPENHKAFTEEMNREYTRFARIYDWSVKLLPVWKTWLKKALPHIKGSRILEISFGTGYLMTRYAGDFDTFGLDYNHKMIHTAAKNLLKQKLRATLVQGDAQSLPFADESFDCIVNTMAFSGYPDGEKALAEMWRVLTPRGRLVLLDFCEPPDSNAFGSALVRMMAAAGDIIRDMPPLFEKTGFSFTDEKAGGFGSVRLFVAEKR